VSEPGVATWEALGTTASVSVSHVSALPRARRAVERELAALDAACSRFRDDSDLARVNKSGGRAVSVSALLLEAVMVSLRAAALTDGIVDPTVGEALVLAGYDRDFGELDGALAVLVGRRVPGWTQVAVDRERGTVRVPPGVLLDLGATAKALGADRAAAAVAAEAPGLGVLVNLGGDLATAGPGPDGGWPLRIVDDHRAPPDEPGARVTIRSGGLATSSTAVRRWGPDAHHIIDPRTGLPAVSPWRTVSVAAATCVDANTASTAAIVLGYDAPGWLAERGLPARLVTDDGEVTTVAGWPAELVAA
jgi:thiamine biosynthesis lipoprotein